MRFELTRGRSPYRISSPAPSASRARLLNGDVVEKMLASDFVTRSQASRARLLTRSARSDTCCSFTGFAGAELSRPRCSQCEVPRCSHTRAARPRLDSTRTARYACQSFRRGLSTCQNESPSIMIPKCSSVFGCNTFGVVANKSESNTPVDGFCTPREIRTPDLLIRSETRYPLCHGGWRSVFFSSAR